MTVKLEEEIKDLRRWRHDLEGQGIMNVVSRVGQIELERHKEALNDVRLQVTIETLKSGMHELSETIKGFQGEVKGLRKMFVVAVVVIALSTVMPDAVIMNVLSAVVKFF